MATTATNGGGGWNRPKANGEPVKTQRKGGVNWVRGAIAGGAIVVLAGLVLWLVGGGDSTRKASEGADRKIADKGRIKSVTPAAAKPKAAPTNAQEVAAAKDNQETNDPKRVVKVFQAWTNGTGVVEDIVLLANGRRVRRVYDPRPVEFINPCDQAIVATLSIPAGQEIPPTPIDSNLDEAFEKSLSIPIEIKEDDPPDLKARKLLVIETRKQIAELKKEGWKVADILHDHIKVNNENAQIRNDAMRELRDIVKSGDAEGAHKYMVTINAAFSQMGIPDIDMPEHPADRRARLKAEREAE